MSYPYKLFSRAWFNHYKNNNTIELLKNNPLISVVVFTNDLGGGWRKLLNSLLEQSYCCFELLLVCDVSQNRQQYVMLLSSTDICVKLVDCNMDDNILSKILRLAEGDYLLFLQAGWSLDEHALVAIVEAIQTRQPLNLIYTDTDRITNNNIHCAPHFKSDWNPDLFFSINYIGNSVVFRSEIFNGYKGTGKKITSDNIVYQCLLHALSHSLPDEIVHIAKVLFHSHTKARPVNIHDISLLTHFLGEMIKKEKSPPLYKISQVDNHFHIQYSLPDSKPLVSLLIPTRDHVNILEACVNSILEKTLYANFEILILDNKSEDAETHNYFEMIAKHPKVKVFTYNQPFNFSAINNYGVTKANGDVLGFINNDIEVINPEWLTEMVSQASRKEIGCVGAKLYYTDGTIQHAGVILGIGGIAGHSHKHFLGDDVGYFSRLKVVQNISAVTAACLVVRKELFNEVGGFDEKNLTVAYNDVDFCLKVLNRGYRNLWTPYAELYHHESISRGRDDVKKNAKRFARERKHMKEKWGEKLLNDPFYNPNLTLKKQDFSIKKHHWLTSLF